MVILLLHALFQLVVQLEYSGAARSLKHRGAQPVQYGGKPCAYHAQAEPDRKKQMLEIAFMDGIQMIVTFPEHIPIVSWIRLSDN